MQYYHVLSIMNQLSSLFSTQEAYDSYTHPVDTAAVRRLVKLQEGRVGLATLRDFGHLPGPNPDDPCMVYLPTFGSFMG